MKPRSTPASARQIETRYGVATPKLKGKRRRAKWSKFFYGDAVALPTAAELAEAEHHAHAEHDHEVEELAEGGKDVPAVLGPDAH